MMAENIVNASASMLSLSTICMISSVISQSAGVSTSLRRAIKMIAKISFMACLYPPLPPSHVSHLDLCDELGDDEEETDDSDDFCSL
jgi:hypothetical protein